MAANIENLRNPIFRSALGAWVGFTAATMVSGAAIGFLNQDVSTFRTARRISYASAIVGAIAAFSQSETHSTKSNKPTSTPASDASDSAWRDWRNFIVDRKVSESAEITSFYLKPQDGGSLPSFKPGQFLTIQLNIPNQARPTIRTYSLSDFGDPVTHYRLSIKRELAPKDLEVPPGLASNFMHDQVHEGDVIPCKPPSGKFVLNVTEPRPIVLISNGVGITPMISMAKAVARLNPQRHVWFLHGARNGEFHAFRDEMEAIATSTPNLQIHYCYSRPRPEDEGLYHKAGYVDAALLEQTVRPGLQARYGTPDAEYFLCGSPVFMDALKSGLDRLGVPKSQIFFESFSKPKAKAALTPAGGAAVAEAEVTFARSGKTVQWHPQDGTLLELAEAQALNPDYSCRQGICLTCMCNLTEGEVNYEEPPTATPDEGAVLICIATPKTPQVSLDL